MLPEPSRVTRQVSSYDTKAYPRKSRSRIARRPKLRGRLPNVTPKKVLRAAVLGRNEAV